LGLLFFLEEVIFEEKRVKNRFLVLLAICLFSSIRAQNWHPFPANSTLIYAWSDPNAIPQDSFLLVIRIDSTALEGNASASYFMRINRPSTIFDTVNTCGENSINPLGIFYDQDHYFGKKMLYENGLCTFISSKGDTFLLQSQAATGASWQWSPGVTATVTSSYIGAVLGQADSLKTISLSNNEQIILAKNNGMVHAYTFLPFAESSSQDYQMDLNLVGNRTLGFGKDIPGPEGYRPTFGPGDRVCRIDYQGDQNGSRQTNINYLYHDTLVGCSYRIHTYYQESYEHISALGTVTNQYQAPILVTPNCVPPSPMPGYLDLLPYEYTPTLASSSQYPAMLVRRHQRISLSQNYRQEAQFVLINIVDTCLKRYLNFELTGNEHYLAGIGLFSRGATYFDQGVSQEGNLIDAYQLGSETYQTCTDLHALSNEAEDIILEPRTGVFPNPTTGILNLLLAEELRGKELSLEILGLEGKILTRQAVPKGSLEYQFDMSSLPKGMYILRLWDKGQVLGTHKISKVD
jgi:hypothetical protein